MASRNTNTASTGFQLYPSRWYILLLFFLQSLLVGYEYNQWGPSYASMKVAFGWTQTQATWFLFLGTLPFSVTIIPCAWVLEKVGLRRHMLLLSGLLVLVNGLKCIPGNSLSVTVIASVTAFLIGIATAMTYFLPAVISAHWFAPNERKLVTSIGNIAPIAGLGFVSLIEPVIIDQSGDQRSITNQYFYHTYGETGASVLLLILILIYFPNQPPTPPSVTANAPRINFLKGVKVLFQNKNFWLVHMPFLFSYGGATVFSSTFSILISKFGINEGLAGKMGFFAIVSGLIFAVLAGKLGDYFQDLKPILIALSFIFMEGMVLFWLMWLDLIAVSQRLIWLTVLITTAAQTASIGINLEMSADVCYPTDEAITVAGMTTDANLVGAVFFIFIYALGGDLTWLVWVLLVSTILTFLSTFFLPTNYLRSDIDRKSMDKIKENERLPLLFGDE